MERLPFFFQGSLALLLCQIYNIPMPKNYFLPLIFLVLLLVSLAACAQASQTATPGVSSTLVPTAVPQTATSTNILPPPAATLAPTQTGSYTDPFVYCADVRNIDAPDSRFNGPHMPDVVAQGLKVASGASADAPIEMFTTGAYWRCMDGKVYACTVGANLPCDSKANTDMTPTQPEIDFCTANPTSDVIPAAVTGHDTIYAWICKAGKPVADKQVFRVDKQGYIVEIWYEIPAPGK
jgi:hypothetical protein